MDIPYLIAGPCSAETREQIFEVASSLAKEGVGVLRAGLWKPRTHPGSFEGVGEKGLQWLMDASREFGLKVCTEVASKHHVQLCLEASVDMVWIGARTSADPFAVQEIAQALAASDIPVLVKNPVGQDLDSWVGAIERLSLCGVRNIWAVLRGVSSFHPGNYRNDPAWHMALSLQTRFPGMRILCDPSHMAGKREYVRELSQKALDLGLDGLMLEVHPCPDSALTDGAQQLSLSDLHSLIQSLRARSAASQNDEYARSLQTLRAGIDEVDDSLMALLGRRMEYSREIGKIKKDNNVTIVQGSRRDAVLRDMLSKGKEAGLREDFVRKFFELVHDESVQIQDDDL